MAFWKNRHGETTFGNEDYDKLVRRLSEMESRIIVINNHIEILGSSLRKLSAKVAYLSRESTTDDSEKDLKSDKLYL